MPQRWTIEILKFASHGKNQKVIHHWIRNVKCLPLTTMLVHTLPQIELSRSQTLHTHDITILINYSISFCIFEILYIWLDECIKWWSGRLLALPCWSIPWILIVSLSVQKIIQSEYRNSLIYFLLFPNKELSTILKCCKIWAYKSIPGSHLFALCRFF